MCSVISLLATRKKTLKDKTKVLTQKQRTKIISKDGFLDLYDFCE